MLESFAAFVYAETLSGRWENAKEIIQKLPESFKLKFRKHWLAIEAKRVESLDDFCDSLGADKPTAHAMKVLRPVELAARAYRDIDAAYVFDAKAEIQNIAAEIQKGDFRRVDEIAKLSKRGSEGLLAAKSAMDIAQDLGNALEKRDEWIRFGFPGLDNRCSGVLKGTVALIGAYTGHGKSAFLASTIANMAKQRRVGFISLEDPCSATFERIACSIAGIEVQHAKHRQNVDRIIDALISVSALNLRVFGPERFPAAGATPEELELAARALVADDCEVLVIDHLSELRPDGHERTDLTYARGMSLMRSIAIEHGIAVVVACQLKKVEGESSPSLYSFAGSSELVRRSRLAITIHRDAEENYVLMVQKATRGGTGFTCKLEMKSGGTFEEGIIPDGGGFGLAGAEVNERKSNKGGRRGDASAFKPSPGLALD